MFAIGEFELKFDGTFLEFVEEDDFTIVEVGPIGLSKNRDDFFPICRAREEKRLVFHQEGSFEIFDGEKSVIKLAVLHSEFVTILLGF